MDKRASDVKWLAKEWDRLLGWTLSPTKQLALYVLMVLGTTYLRGQGKRLGSPKAFLNHVGAQLAITQDIVNYVVGEASPDIWFPNLTKLGLTDLASITQELSKGLFRSEDD